MYCICICIRFLLFIFPLQLNLFKIFKAGAMADSVSVAGHLQVREGLWRDMQLEGNKEVPAPPAVPYASSGKCCPSLVPTGKIPAGKARAREPKRGGCPEGEMTVDIAEN